MVTRKPIKKLKNNITRKKIPKSSNSFLSSCFNYYYNNIQHCKNKSCIRNNLSVSFTKTKNHGSLIIIDYPNIIHILYEEFKERTFHHIKYLLF